MDLFSILSIIITLLIAIYMLFLIKKNRHNSLSYFKQEKEVLALERKRLADLIKEKTIELAVKAKEDDNKLRLLNIIREKIEDGEKNPNILHYRLREIKRMLDEYLEIDNKTFEIQMDEIHQDFFKKMKNAYPNLSIYELRLCAYLKIGLTSKEMSEILRILPSSINVSRSRLRKKLNISHEVDLYTFLNDI